MVLGWSVVDGNDSWNVLSEIKETVVPVSNSIHNGLSFSFTCTVKGLTDLPSIVYRPIEPGSCASVVIVLTDCPGGRLVDTFLLESAG